MDQLEEINDERDHEWDSPTGYYTRAKRRKLSEKYQDKEDFFCKGLFRVSELKRKNPIMFMPTEILQNILRRISYHQLSTNVRLVNRRFRTIAEDLLNLGFKKLESKLYLLIKSTDISLGFTQDDMEIKCISKLLCQLEILNLQYATIMSTIWRYVYNEFYRAPHYCMYGGLIIDTHETFIWKFVHCPDQLYSQAVVRDYDLPSEVSDIVQMTKSFCVHFDKTNEETSAHVHVWSGCKLVDILDTAKFADRIVYFEKLSADRFFAKYSYYFKNSWFVAMPIPLTKTMDWPQKQRMMHMRLRRIVLAHNDMYLQEEQYQRETALRPNAPMTIKKPGNNVYTGYGDIETKFFYYGVMNDGAYNQKFHPDEENDDLDEGDINEFVVQNRGDIELVPINSDDDVLYRLQYLGFKVDVTVSCPPQYAPLKYLRSLPSNEKNVLINKLIRKDNTHIHMNFECLGAHYARLPTKYLYIFDSKKIGEEK
ncbi:uncharacterized protein LOC143202038 isoform X2 [Rhynchophorus ferrugineus]|uniref:uncharacterized protein LOC143202038 isoform X2 n=1 Tax=Rhynchophorus ferrugineus TaxID=354439 RepID=UPI003FCEDAAD